MSILLDRETILNKVKSREFASFIEKFKISNVMVFGSVLTNDFNEESDVDIAILGDENILLDNILDMELYLEGFLHRDIDIIDLRSTTLDMFVRINILNSGEVIYSTNPELLEKYMDEVEWNYRENENFIYFRKVDVLYE
ncbi:MAG: nucleotidyltransferase domain-containing protein [Clostridium sp.]